MCMHTHPSSRPFTLPLSGPAPASKPCLSLMMLKGPDSISPAIKSPGHTTITGLSDSSCKSKTKCCFRIQSFMSHGVWQKQSGRVALVTRSHRVQGLLGSVCHSDFCPPPCLSLKFLVQVCRLVVDFLSFTLF